MIPYFQDYTVSLASANDSKVFDVHGDAIACYQAAEEFQVSLEGGANLLFNQGIKLGWGAAQKVQIKITPKAGAVTYPNKIVIRVLEDSEKYQDLRFSVSAPIAITPGTVFRPAVAARLATLADLALVADTNTAIFSANADAESVDVWNHSTTVSVRIATATADLTATRGLIIPPQSSRTVRQNGDLYARAIGGAATVSVNLTSFV